MSTIQLNRRSLLQLAERYYEFNIENTNRINRFTRSQNEGKFNLICDLLQIEANIRTVRAEIYECELND